MSLGTYSGLLATLADYLERADLTPHLPGFISLAETRLNRRLGLSENEVLARLDLVAGRAPLPDDYASWRSVNGPQGWSLEYAPPHVFLASYGRAYGLGLTGQGDGYDDVATGSQGGRPRFFTIIGSIPLDDLDADISIWPNGLDKPFLLTGPSWAGRISLVYRQGLPSLGAQRDTNWLLQKSPDLYLYASLLEAQPFLKDDARITTWRALMEEAIGDVQALDRAARWGRSRIRTTEATP